MHLVSVTPGAAEQQLRQQQGILGWEARAAPSATPLSASQSSCSKQRRREHRQAGVILQSFTILSAFIISADVKSSTKQTSITQAHLSPASLKHNCPAEAQPLWTFLCM